MDTDAGRKHLRVTVEWLRERAARAADGGVSNRGPPRPDRRRFPASGRGRGVLPGRRPPGHVNRSTRTATTERPSRPLALQLYVGGRSSWASARCTADSR
jgi:hypothetical protein